MERNHTPAPWQAEYDDMCERHIIDMEKSWHPPGEYAPQRAIWWEHGLNPEEFPEQWSEVEANVNLIRAAPEVLDIALAAINVLRPHDAFAADTLAAVLEGALEGKDEQQSLEEFTKRHGLDSEPTP